MKNLLTYNSYILKRIGMVALIFILLQILLRFAFLALEHNNISLSLSETLTMFSVGFVYDIATFSYFLIPYIFYLVLLPKKFHLGKLDVILTSCAYGIVLYLLVFDLVSEWVFWDEFSVRFNFIAVDYLIYTQEVLHNIWESYPIIWILLSLGLIVSLLFYFTKRSLLPHADITISPLKTRLIHALIYLVFPLGFYATLDLGKTEVTHNSYANEITKNGIYSLFAAFMNNELSYEKFYLSDYQNEQLPPIKDLMAEDETGQTFVNDDPDDITRFVPSNEAEKHKNVIIVTMESMSTSFMTYGGNDENLTPQLDDLTQHSLFFNNSFATGTRTVRGLEAITLSIPPSPGRSIIKRQNNENLASLGFVFKDRGYDTKFIYGGYGYFDNMNYFFAHNGYDIVDRSHFDDGEESFANAWGLCDEDLFKKVIKEARQSYDNHTPFMHMVMTTSNHRPYTFPTNDANIPVKGGGRAAGVKYADYAVGKFLEAAKKEPWFQDTVFIFVADHTAGSAGKAELTIEKYHIPLMIYSPSFIPAQTIPNLTSQIDVAPILLGLLDFSYYSRFYGENILNDPDEQAHAFVGNYQKLGYINDNSLVILKPGKDYSHYHAGKVLPKESVDQDLLLETISYYKHAANWRTHNNKIESTVKQ